MDSGTDLLANFGREYDTIDIYIELYERMIVDWGSSILEQRFLDNLNRYSAEP